MSEKGRVEKEGRVIVGCWPVKERGPPGCKKSADGVQPCRVLRGSRSPRNREWEERLLLVTPRTIAACINPQKSFFTILLFHSPLTGLVLRMWPGARRWPHSKRRRKRRRQSNGVINPGEGE